MTEFSDSVGRSRRHEDVLDPWRVHALRATLGGPAMESGALPCLWQWIYFLTHTPRDQLGEDGHARLGGFLPAIPARRRMFAGGRVTIETPLRIGHPASMTETILNIEQKRAGPSPLWLVTVGYDYAQDGQVCVREARDLVYLDAAPAPAPADVTPLPDDAAWTSEVTPDPVMLARYSALTFNGHRIHYDADYCRDVEGYPERVVHGPLTATLLLELGRQAGLGEITGFSFRAQSPLFVNAPIRLQATRTEDGLEARAYTPQGRVAMSARMTVD
jgi:3-methylfumaryl-CoA hydratase